MNAFLLNVFHLNSVFNDNKKEPILNIIFHICFKQFDCRRSKYFEFYKPFCFKSSSVSFQLKFRIGRTLFETTLNSVIWIVI